MRTSACISPTDEVNSAGSRRRLVRRPRLLCRVNGFVTRSFMQPAVSCVAEQIQSVFLAETVLVRGPFNGASMGEEVVHVGHDAAKIKVPELIESQK